MIPFIQPELLTMNQRTSPANMTVGNLYQASHPWGFPGPFIVMLVQAGTAITGRGYLCRQEMCILAAGETSLDCDATGTTTYLADADHGVTAATIPGTEYIDGTTTNSGYWLWKEDALASTTFAGNAFETAEVVRNNGAGFFLSPQHPLDSNPASGDAYVIWRPGRVQMCDLDEVLPVWGVSCAAITDEYYGFIVVKGWWEVLGDTTVNMSLGDGIQVGNANGTAEGSAAADGGWNIGAITMYGATGAEVVPVYVTGYAC